MATQVCSGGFLMKKNKFLFGKRSQKKSWAPKLWDIVGGHSREEENPFETLKRETYEETGITVLNARLLTSVNVWDKKDDGFFRYHIFMITAWKGKALNCSDEHSKLRWFTREQMATKNVALKEYLPLIDNWLNG